MFSYIGYIKTLISQKVDHNWGENCSEIVIHEDLADGLKGLTDFSHIIVVFHLNEAKFIKENHLVRKPQGRKSMPDIGIFAQRGKDRPNPIGITAVKLISVNRNIISVRGLDAINGTPVLDIKPYYPQYDLKSDAQVPDWVNILMKDYF